MKHYKFPCGCTFPLIQEHEDKNILPYINWSFEDITHDCPATWDLLARGITKGVFQLESNLGRTWTKKLQPETMEHLCALGSILRPGVLRAIDPEEQCTMTELFCRRKNGQAEVKYIHPCLEPILKPTYGVLCYQEQSMIISQVVAGFNLQEADELRKAIGKKLPEEMAKVKVKFFEGAAKTNIVSKEDAIEIFGWIEKSQRYAFNKSHSYSYAVNGYLSAYAKAHDALRFYTSWLYYAKDKQDPYEEMRELINEAKIMDVEVLPPNICTLEPNFSTDGKVVTFGISDVKGIGGAQVSKLNEATHRISTLLGKPINLWSWYEFLVHLTPCLSNTFITNMISVGGLRHFGSNRSLMLKEYETWDALTAKEQEWIRLRSLPKYTKMTLSEQCKELFGFKVELVEEEKYLEELGALPTFSCLQEALKNAANVKKEGGAAANVKRKSIIESLSKLLENPPSPIQDTPTWIAWNEENLLGISLTCTKVDACDISQSNCTCKEFLAGRDGYMVFAVQVDAVRVITTKKGKSVGSKMAFLTVSDSTCAVEMVVFPQAWEAYANLLNEGNTLAIQGKRDTKNGSLVLEKAFQI